MALDLKKSQLDLLIRGLDNFTTMEPYFGGLKSLCDNFYYNDLNSLFQDFFEPFSPALEY